jgi:hypothetical protein
MQTGAAKWCESATCLMRMPGSLVMAIGPMPCSNPKEAPAVIRRKSKNWPGTLPTPARHLTFAGAAVG